ncbi:ABC transporter permease subunit [Parablautia muri]|uniref:ABC transporter permease n=1 Tax=Parablautia muri TaxID=2320879 RepID=A0A9X5GTP0_9FIRM|nr:ABC transporter permease subunit [Parablautia muri]NBJ93985.1 ABC transporter permease [Parablautia muri]
MTLFIQELKMGRKQLLAWTICIGICCFGCILLFQGLEETMEEMGDVYAQMGAFATALNLDRMDAGTMEGFFATEISMIFAVGGAMFAAMMGICMLTKEEEGHTVEFLNTLPFGRNYIVVWKYIAMTALIALLNGICLCWELLGFICAGEMMPLRELLLFHGAQFLMHLEVGSICFLASVFCRKKQMGASLGFAILLYGMDLMCRIVPDLKNLKYVTPYYFSNAAEIFINGSIEGKMVGISVVVIVFCGCAAAVLYKRKDF